ncbi:hypothetical protein PUN28_004489 [Cardiocondyla obscurior]
MRTSMIVMICLFGTIDGARILAIFPYPIKSHYVVYEPLLKALSAKGHEITAVTHFPQKVHLANFTDVDVSSSSMNWTNNRAVDHFSIWTSFKFMLNSKEHCEHVLDRSEVKQIVNAKEHFDLLLSEIFITDCMLGFAHVLNISKIVGVTSTTGLPWLNSIVRNPENPSYIPNFHSSYSDQMSLIERLYNTAVLLISKFVYRIGSDWISYNTAKNYFGYDLPNFDTLRSKISLILINGHPAVSTVRPLAPRVKEIAGIHIPISGPKPLPVDLQDYLDSQSSNGVIYFSLGSQIDMSTIPDQVFAALYRAFEQVPQQILWTCAKGRMPSLPRNVKCIGWAPQLSVLCHPNTRLLINHGGLLGIQEAIYCGVPIIGIPIFGDHFLNMAHVVKKGLALEIKMEEFSYKQFSSSLKEILSNKSYTETARKISLQFKDRPMPPIEEAVYWVEHTIRHDLDFLKTGAIELTWYQYLLLDVALIFISILLFVIWFSYKLIVCLLSTKKKAHIVRMKKMK